jgi:hypothetical protein
MQNQGLGGNAPPTKHARLLAWVDEVAALTKPKAIHWCDGSEAEWTALTDELVALGTLRRLAPASAQTRSTPPPTRATSPASRAAPSSARKTRPTPARPTTGAIQSRCAGC